MANSPDTGLVKDESVLVTEAKAGSYEAFEDLVNRYEKKIYRLGLNLTGNPEDAEDLLQETFLKAFQHLPSFRDPNGENGPGHAFIAFCCRRQDQQALQA